MNLFSSKALRNLFFRLSLFDEECNPTNFDDDYKMERATDLCKVKDKFFRQETCSNSKWVEEKDSKHHETLQFFFSRMQTVYEKYRKDYTFINALGIFTVLFVFLGIAFVVAMCFIEGVPPFARTLSSFGFTVFAISLSELFQYCSAKSDRERYIASYYQNKLIEWVHSGEDMRPSILLFEEKVEVVEKIYKSVGVFGWGSYLKVSKEIRKTLGCESDILSVAMTSRDIKKNLCLKSIVKIGTVAFALLGLFLFTYATGVNQVFDTYDSIMVISTFAIILLSFIGSQGFNSSRDKSVRQLQEFLEKNH